MSIDDDEIHKMADYQEKRDKKKAKAEKIAMQYFYYRIGFIIGFYLRKIVIFCLLCIALGECINLFMPVTFYNSVCICFVLCTILPKRRNSMIQQTVAEMFHFLVYKKEINHGIVIGPNNLDYDM